MNGLDTIVSFLFVLSIFNKAHCDYWDDRKVLLDNEAFKTIGSLISLNENEQLVNDLLMKWKRLEFDEGLKNPSTFLPSQHFFRGKEGIENSDVFKFIKGLPKGASLHTHSTSMASMEYIFNQTFRENLYGCMNGDQLKIQFFFDNATSLDCEWKLLSEIREDDSEFNDFLQSQLTLIVEDIEAVYPDINAVWESLNRGFSLVSSLLYYKPVFEDYVRQTIQEFYDDNVMYLEIRGGLGSVVDSNGTQYSDGEIINIYKEAITEFQKTNQDFLGIRYIYSKSRRNDNNTIASYINKALMLQSLYPEFIVGFDLVGQEDLGEPLVNFADQLLEVANATKFFFHAGETNWNGATTDLNLIDAVLLNTTRIGHAFGILKHSEVLRQVKKKNIALEINPISNQVLKLVDDIRNHPGTFLIGNDYPVVITCDDPTFWGAKGVSYDWYMAFMGMTSRDGDLRILKQLAANSIAYSSLDDNLKLVALETWSKNWDEYIDNIVQNL